MKTNEITTITTAQMSFSDMSQLAKVFAESGMFSDSKSVAQAIVKIQAGQELGIPPFASMSGVHIIQGRPTIGAVLMAGKVKSSGKYDYKVIEQSDNACLIDFYQNGAKVGTSRFTMDDAKKAQTKNLDKYPRNMLFARAISNGVKWYCPDLFATSVYTPEEMNSGEFTEHDVIVEEVKGNPILDIVQRLRGADNVDVLSDLYRSLTTEQQAHPEVIEAAKFRKKELTTK